MSGFTGTGDKYEPAGIVHRGERWGPCSCGGRVHYYDDGEVISHSLPLDKNQQHRAPYPPGVHLLFDYKLVE